MPWHCRTDFRLARTTAPIKHELRRETPRPLLPLARLRLFRLADFRRFYAALSREHFLIA